MFYQKWPFWAVFGGISALIGLLAIGFQFNPKKVESPLIGKPAKAFEVTHLFNGQKLKLEDWQGKPMVLNFWASWCTECIVEAPVLESYYQRYQVRQQQVNFLGIAIQDTPEAARQFAKRHGKTYFLALDHQNSEISLEYGIFGVPETFFIDADGIIRYKHIGAVNANLMETQISQLLQSDTSL